MDSVENKANKAKKKAADLAALEKARQSFSVLLREFERANGSYIDRAPRLPQELLERCQVFGSRYEILHRLPKGGIGMEVGTDKGEFAAKIMEIVAPDQLHILELDPSRIDPKYLSGYIQSGQCVLHIGDSKELLRSFPAKHFDFIYIDANHKYEGVREDLLASVPLLKDDGLLMFNDYNVWSISSMSRCGVARAVNEFAIREKWEFVYFALQSTMYCDVALRRKQ